MWDIFDRNLKKIILNPTKYKKYQENTRKSVQLVPKNGTAKNLLNGHLSPKAARTPSGPLPWALFPIARGLDPNMEFFGGGSGGEEK